MWAWVLTDGLYILQIIFKEDREQEHKLFFCTLELGNYIDKHKLKYHSKAFPIFTLISYRNIEVFIEECLFYHHHELPPPGTTARRMTQILMLVKIQQVGNFLNRV